MLPFVYTVVRNSNAIEEIECDLLGRECVVTYKNGASYLYYNVSRRSMMNLMMNKNISLGFWVNNNILNKGCFTSRLSLA